MATSAWIESASRGDSKPVGTEYMSADHLLALPAQERAAAIAERRRARRAVQRIAGDHAAEVLEALGLEVS